MTASDCNRYPRSAFPFIYVVCTIVCSSIAVCTCWKFVILISGYEIACDAFDHVCFDFKHLRFSKLARRQESQC